MEFLKAFPIAIIDEDYESKQAAGIGMRQLSEAIEKEGFRVVAGVSYADAQGLVEVFNSESCWIVSVDGIEEGARQWQILEEVLAAKRRRNDRLPIFLFGDKRTAEMVPASVLKHANAFMHLFEDSPTFLARVIVRAANLYIERLPPPMFKALKSAIASVALGMPPDQLAAVPQEPLALPPTRLVQTEAVAESAPTETNAIVMPRSRRKYEGLIVNIFARRAFQTPGRLALTYLIGVGASF